MGARACAVEDKGPLIAAAASIMLACRGRVNAVERAPDPPWPVGRCSGLRLSAVGRDLLGLNRLARGGIVGCVWLTLGGFLATLDDVSDDVAPPCDAVCPSSPESSRVNKNPALSTESACAVVVMLVHLDGEGAVSGTDIGFLVS